MRPTTRLLCCLLILLAGPKVLGDEASPAGEPKLGRPLLHVAVGPRATHLLLGTLHIMDTRVSTVHPLVEVALSKADELVAEIAFDEASQVGLWIRGQLPRNRPLNTLLDDGLEKRIQALLARSGGDLESVQRVKPWLLEHHIGEMLAPRATRDTVSLDERLQRAAKKLGTPVVGLETPEEQTSILDDYPLEVQVERLEETVSLVEADLRNGTNAVEEMIQAWLTGDPKRLIAEVHRYFDFELEEHRELFAKIHDERNATMLERLAERVRTSPDQVRLIAVGAAHLPGPRGMVQLLQAEGYTTWRVMSPADLPATHAQALDMVRKRAAPKALPREATSRAVGRRSTPVRRWRRRRVCRPWWCRPWVCPPRYAKRHSLR